MSISEEVQRPGCDTDHSLSPIADVHNALSCTFTSVHVYSRRDSESSTGTKFSLACIILYLVRVLCCSLWMRSPCWTSDVTRNVTSSPSTYSVWASILGLRDVTIAHGARQPDGCWTSLRSHCKVTIRFMNLQSLCLLYERGSRICSHYLVYNLAEPRSGFLTCKVSISSPNLHSHDLVF